MPQNIKYSRAKVAATEGKQVARQSWLPGLYATYNSKTQQWELGTETKRANWEPLITDVRATDWYLVNP